MAEEKKDANLMVRIPVELRDRFKKVAILKDTTMGEAIRGFIEEYVSEYENPRLQKKRIRKPRPKVKKKAGENIAEENNQKEDSKE